MSFTPRSQAPETDETLFAHDRLFTKEDVQPYLFNLQNQGVTWNTVEAIAEEYITTNNLSFDTNPGGPLLEQPCYLYTHTITQTYEVGSVVLTEPKVPLAQRAIALVLGLETFGSEHEVFDRPSSRCAKV